MINKKMMLCAAIGGESAEDIKNMIITPYDHITCTHFNQEPVWIPLEISEKLNFDTAVVELTELIFAGESCGKVGRCSKCNRIYYKEAN